MPTVLIENGFRFFFYSNEGDEPMHIHIEKGGSEGKVWLSPLLASAYMNGFSPKEERQILDIISNNIIKLQQKWNEYFGK
jgi:hypothetical protein